MPYFIKRKPDNVYVSKPGSRSSYTKNILNAKSYPTKYEAEKDLCPENEYITFETL